MKEEIYHLNEQEGLNTMEEDPIKPESKLQELVAQYPQLLSGVQMDPDNPRRWLLIGREQGIADIVGAGDRWSVDHLLMDQDAIPTLVEAKLSGNPEIRRTVVGQMMDYAAHATQTWKATDIRQAFEKRCNSEGKDPNEEVITLLQPDGEPDVDKFWEDVETNLRSARLRLLFVADGIPAELARVVEFLNEQMPRTEVLAVEIKQFSGEKGSTLVPRVIGRTASAPDRTAKRRSNKTLEEILKQMPSLTVRQAAQCLIDLTKEKGGIVYPGSTSFSIRYISPAFKHPISLAWINPIPDYSGWMGTKNFTFGAYDFHDYEPNDRPPGKVVNILQLWADQFSGDSFVSKFLSKGFNAWVVSHDDLAANVDIIAERLGKVLDELQSLSTQEQ